MKHPEALSEVNDLKITEDIKEYIVKLSSEISDADGQRDEWKRNDEEYYKARYGIRYKKDFPWPNSANYVLPLIDANIERAKPSYINLFAKSNPPVSFVPYGPEDIEPAKKREKLFNWRLRTKTNFFKPYCIGVDKMLQHGYVVFKVFWNYSTRKYTEFIDITDFPQKVVDALYDPRLTDDGVFQIFIEEFRPDAEIEENLVAIREAVKKFRDGETEIEVTLMERENDQAEILACNPLDITVPNDTTDIQQARFVDYVYWSTKNDLKIAMRDGKFLKQDDNDLDRWVSTSADKRNAFGRSNDILVKEGIQLDANLSELILVHETCCMYDIDGDGIQERCICTWPDASPSDVLRFIELPYDHGHWPYAQIKMELTDDGFYSSRGLPAKDYDFQVGISNEFNSMANNNTLVNCPVLEVNENLVSNAKNLRYVPGAKVITKGQGGFELKQVPNVNQASFIETMRILKSWSQERNGLIQFAFTDTLNEQGKRTATESVQMGQVFDLVASVAVQIFQDQMKEVYYQLDALWYQFGSDEEEVAITGEQPLKVSRREIQGQFNLVPNGRLDNSNPNLRLAIAQNLLMGFRGDPDVNQAELKRLYLDYLDNRYTQLLLKSPEQKQQEAQYTQMLAEQARAQAMGDDAKVKSIEAQLNMMQERNKTTLEIQKEIILAPVMGKKYSKKD